MKKQLLLGLVLEGSSTRSAVLRLPKLSHELGPVKSSSVRVARRFSNLVQGGYAVEDYQELEGARLILMHLPDGAVRRVVDEICASDLLVKRLCFVLCETWLSSDVLAPLQDRGASVATMVQAPGTQRNWFVVEGHLTASRLARRLIERLDGRAFEIKAGSKHLLFAAELLTAILPVPLLASAQQSLRAAGMSGNQLSELTGHMAQRLLRDVTKGVRLPLPTCPPDCSIESYKRLMTELEQRQPRLASLLQDGLAQASAYRPLVKKEHSYREEAFARTSTFNPMAEES